MKRLILVLMILALSDGCAVLRVCSMGHPCDARPAAHKRADRQERRRVAKETRDLRRDGVVYLVWLGGPVPVAVLVMRDGKLVTP